MNSEAADAGRGKSGLVRVAIDAMAKKNLRLSRRRAEKVVNATFTLMKRALRRGERVELPVGQIWVKPLLAKRNKREMHKFRDIAREGFVYHLVEYPDRIIRFRPKKELIERAPFAPPPPKPLHPSVLRKAEEVEQLFHEITGNRRQIQVHEFAMLMDAADKNLDWLLARLRQLKKEGVKTGIYRLAGTVRQMFWVRPSLLQNQKTSAKKTSIPECARRKSTGGMEFTSGYSRWTSH